MTRAAHDVLVAGELLDPDRPAGLKAVGGDAYLRAFFFYCSGDHRDLHSFPTRRSSDLFGIVFVSAPARGARAANCTLQPCSSRLPSAADFRSEEHTSELQSLAYLVC